VPVADLSSVEIPIPLNWQDFQRACVPLFRNVLPDPHAQEWGREGQDQHGIDVFGFSRLLNFSAADRAERI
jgi:hypothetical protein